MAALHDHQAVNAKSLSSSNPAHFPQFKASGLEDDSSVGKAFPSCKKMRFNNSHEIKQLHQGKITVGGVFKNWQELRATMNRTAVSTCRKVKIRRALKKGDRHGLIICKSAFQRAKEKRRLRKQYGKLHGESCECNICRNDMDCKFEVRVAYLSQLKLPPHLLTKEIRTVNLNDDAVVIIHMVDHTCDPQNNETMLAGIEPERKCQRSGTISSDQLVALNMQHILDGNEHGRSRSSLIKFNEVTLKNEHIPKHETGMKALKVKALKAAERAIELVHGKEMDQYKAFPSLFQKHILALDSESQLFLHTVPRPDMAEGGEIPQMFVSATFISGAFLRIRRLMRREPGISWCRVLVYDTTYLKDGRGQVDHLVMKLPGDYSFPVGMNVHFRNESTDTWRQTLKDLRTAVEMDPMALNFNYEDTFMSDAMKGIDTSLRELLHDVSKTLCIFHSEKNMKKHHFSVS